MNTRKIAMSLTLLAGTLAVGAAQARGPEVQWSVTLATPMIRLPGHVVLPLPPIPVPRFVTVEPNRGIAHHDPRYDPRYERGYDRGYGDADRDGIPNRHDSVYSPRWDRDGDGVPNRYDARPADPRRDWRDHRRNERHDGRRGHRGD